MAASTVGVVASGVGITSLAIQLNGSLNKAVNFCESFKEGPESLARIAEELRMLTNIIHMIQLQEESAQSDDVSQ
jgi:hypothetical protein